MSSNVPFSEFLEPYDEFNSAIRSHVAFADSRPEVRAALTTTTRIAFLEIIRRANIENSQQPIWVRVDCTARRTGISTKSVSRTIKMMKAKGWLVPSATHDGRNNNGEYAGREYFLTPAMRRLMSLPDTCINKGPANDDGRAGGTTDTPLQLPSPTSTPAASADTLPVEQARFSATAATASTPSLPPGSSLSKAFAMLQRRTGEIQAKKQISDVTQLQEVAAEPVENPVGISVLPSEPEGEKYVEQTDLSSGVIYAVNKVFSLKEASLHKEAFFEKSETRKTPKLPADLVSLQTELEISPEGVCSLMKLAKEMGHRLQDVWKVKRAQLLNSGAKHGRAVKYLRFLLTCGEDFSYLARTKVPDLTPIAGSSASRVPSKAFTQASPSTKAAEGATQGKSNSVSPEVLRLREIAKATRFKRFRHITNDMVVRFYDGVAEVTRGFVKTVVAGWRDLEAFYVGISRGNLVPVAE
jgi:hypothetical protein